MPFGRVGEPVVRLAVRQAMRIMGHQFVMGRTIEEALARATGGQVRCGYAVDAGLVGGVAVRIGSSVFDGSVRGHLDALRRRLVSGS